MSGDTEDCEKVRSKMNPTDKLRFTANDLVGTARGFPLEGAAAKVEAALISAKSEGFYQGLEVAAQIAAEGSCDCATHIRSLIVPKGDSKEWQHDPQAEWTMPKGDV